MTAPGLPCAFHIANDHGKHPIDAEVVQAATKWKRMALAQFDMKPGEGLVTDMRAVRKDYFLDHDHSAYVDQWDWERTITAEQRTLATLTETVRAIWRVIRSAEELALEMYPQLRDPRYPSLPDEIEFVHAEDLLARYPDLPRKQRETAFLQEHPAVFIYGIGWTLADGYPHELRAADYDDWVTETVSADGRPMHGLNGDILVWNPVTHRRHELSSMGVRVTKESLATAARADRPARLPGVAVPPRDPRRPDPALDRRRDRPVAGGDAAAPQGPSRGGERDRVAGRAQEDVCRAEHPRARVRERSGSSVVPGRCIQRSRRCGDGLPGGKL